MTGRDSGAHICGQGILISTIKMRGHCYQKSTFILFFRMGSSTIGQISHKSTGNSAKTSRNPIFAEHQYDPGDKAEYPDDHAEVEKSVFRGTHIFLV